MVIRRQRAFTNGELYADLALGTTRGPGELKFSDPVLVVWAFQVLERDAEGADQGLGCLGGLRVEDLEGEHGFVEWEGEWEREPLVPDRMG